ncbi:MAG TPA: FAD-dependent thymidylate synthase, partial [Bacteroidales bacterium]|nr:FAD-dependent thymidylate synthase [Bacteroidales bacterium]
MEVRITNDLTDIFRNIENAASKCYSSTPTETFKILQKCINSRHDSVLEHSHITFEVDGVSRALLAQLTRHRIASFSVQSQRYVNQTKNKECFNYVIPKSIRNTKDTRVIDTYIDCMRTINEAYNKLIDLKIDKEDARYVLPNACETNLCVTMNLRSFINMCNERLCSKAQDEIRELFKKMKIEFIDEISNGLDETEEIIAVLEKALQPKCIKIGKCFEEKPCGYLQ